MDNKKNKRFKLWSCLCRNRKKLFFLFILLLLASVPSLIDFLYLKGRYLTMQNTFFSAGDWLSFYGTIIGAGSTIIALVLTIQHNRKQQIMGAKPLLQSSSNRLSLAEDVDRIERVHKYLRYPFNNEDIVGSSESFTSTYIYRKDNPQIIDTKEYLLFSYTVSNAGLGAAVGVNLKINGLVSLPKFYVSNAEAKIFVFIVGKEKVDTTLNISLQYTDVFGQYVYTQHEQFHICADADGYLSYTQTLENLLSNQTINKYKEDN